MNVIYIWLTIVTAGVFVMLISGFYHEFVRFIPDNKNRLSNLKKGQPINIREYQGDRKIRLIPAIVKANDSVNHEIWLEISKNNTLEDFVVSYKDDSLKNFELFNNE